MSEINPSIKNAFIDGVRLKTVELPPYFISPDIEKAMNYYGKYLEEALELEKVIRTPAAYLNLILAQVGDTGERREEILRHYSQYVGSQKVLDQIEEAWAIYNKAKRQKHYVRITDKSQKSKIYPVGIGIIFIKGKLKKGESLMIEPIKFKVEPLVFKDEESNSSKK